MVPLRVFPEIMSVIAGGSLVEVVVGGTTEMISQKRQRASNADLSIIGDVGDLLPRSFPPPLLLNFYSCCVMRCTNRQS